MTSQEKGAGSPWQRFWRAVDERLGLEGLRYEIPDHGNSLAYTLGGITFFGLAILVVTGVVLTQFYHPHPSEANASLRALMASVALGTFLRGLHFWTAQAVVVSVTLHAFRVFITAAYKRPREFNWLVGVALLALTLSFFFTGTVLKWDQEAFEALEHNLEVSNFLGALGALFTPGFAESVPLLTRLYSVHVTVLPLGLALLLLAHVYYVRLFGISRLPWKTSRGTTLPFTAHLRKIAGFGVLLLAIVAILAVAFPPSLGPEPIEGIEVTKPPWPFLWLYAVENFMGIRWLLPASVVPFAVLVTIPFLDRGDERDPRRRRAILLLFLVGVAVILVLTLLAILTVPQAHIGG